MHERPRAASRRLAPLASLAVGLALGASARAQTPPGPPRPSPTTLQATSAPGCEALREQEAAAARYRAWEHTQPFGQTEAYAYSYMFDDIMSGAGALGDALLWPFVTVAPHVGVRIGTGQTEAVVSWPWSLPFGPDETCRLIGRALRYEGQKRHRALLEPGLLLGPHTGGFLRPGYRYLAHPDAGPVGLGVGLGATVERLPGSPWRASVSPEVLVHHGACCSAGYATVAVRYDRFLAGRDRDMVTVSLGLTFY